MRQLQILALSCAFCALAAVSQAPAAQIYLDPLYGVQVTKNVLYGYGATTKGLFPLYADIYQPLDIGLAPVLEDRPAVVLQDGGAWASASKERGRITAPAIYMAQRGFTSIVTDYRQGNPFDTSSPLSVVPVVGQTQFGTEPYNGVNIPFPYSFTNNTAAVRAGIEDFAVAIDWTRTNAATLGIDPNRIGIAGGSAGGIDALLLQYANNNNPINPAYAAQAVIALVSTTYGNHGKIQPGGPPVFLLNNTADPVVIWEPQMSARFTAVGIYNEQWFQKTQVNHDVDINEIIYDSEGVGKPLLERMAEFLAYQLAGGPVPVVVPEPSTLILALTAGIALGVVPLRRRGKSRASR